jgi:hypothetical protein
MISNQPVGRRAIPPRPSAAVRAKTHNVRIVPLEQVFLHVCKTVGNQATARSATLCNLGFDEIRTFHNLEAPPMHREIRLTGLTLIVKELNLPAICLWTGRAFPPPNPVHTTKILLPGVAVESTS